MNVFQFSITCKRTDNANNATYYVKLGKKRRESSKRNYYIIPPRVIIKAIIIIISFPLDNLQGCEDRIARLGYIDVFVVRETMGGK